MVIMKSMEIVLRRASKDYIQDRSIFNQQLWLLSQSVKGLKKDLSSFKVSTEFVLFDNISRISRAIQDEIPVLIESKDRQVSSVRTVSLYTSDAADE